MIADSINVKLSGLINACRVAKNEPANPPNIAPIAKAVNFVFVGFTPKDLQAISSSLKASQAWEALREDEIACKSLGVNPTNTKLTAFAIGAMFGGFAGSFFATRQAFISPESFTFIESAIIVAIVVLGGMGSQTGVVLASIFLIGITEMFRDLEQYRMIAFGGAMVLIMVFKPKGILANRKPTILMHGDKK